ncbi:hypothetical protein [Pyrodictium occultum]|nr:hypothetical protein [Pyrodictium occultum]
MALALLFAYKAATEIQGDKVWGIIYALISLEYLFEAPVHPARRH